MLKNILSFEKLPKNLDSTDGLAAAVCHHFNKNHFNKNKIFFLRSYVEQNPKEPTSLSVFNIYTYTRCI